jgi:4-amino-4-deoxychorismate lyase
VFLETLRCEGGKARYLSYHQQRLNKTLRAVRCSGTHNLERLITPPDDALYRCRFLYDCTTYRIEYIPYTLKPITSLRILIADSIDYPFKSADRTALDELFTLRGGSDDVAIIRNGLLTDTTIANIALYDGKQWLTPENPLLEGTTRERLIAEGFLIPAPIRLEDIPSFKKVAVLNALMGFVEVENGIII